MTATDAVAFTKAMREAGAEEFSLEGDKLWARLRPPEPTKLVAIAEAMGELPVEERERLLADARRELDADLYGSAT